MIGLIARWGHNVLLTGVALVTVAAMVAQLALLFADVMTSAEAIRAIRRSASPVAA